MSFPRIHLVAPAGSCREFLKESGIGSASGLIALVQDAVGSRYEVTGCEKLIDADEDERRGGRRDDRERAVDLVRALGDDDVAAIVAVRGGAWLARVLPSIDFGVLNRRTRPVAVFGFSEITTLVNIIGAYEQGRGVYDNSPAFLVHGLRRFAEAHADSDVLDGASPEEWMRRRLVPEFRAFFHDVVSMIEGRGTGRRLTARSVSGSVSESCQATFIGGNLTVLTTLPASPYRSCIEPGGKWLVLEDYRESPARLDRMMAQLTLAGYFESCEGVLLGDFHRDGDDLIEPVVSLLRYHFPPTRSVPILVTSQIGHTWPMHPLPVHVPVTIKHIDGDTLTITWPASAVQTV